MNQLLTVFCSHFKQFLFGKKKEPICFLKGAKLNLYKLAISVVLSVFIVYGYSSSKPVTMVEYFDYNCPVCRHYIPLLRRYASHHPDIKVVSRVVPALAKSSWYIDIAMLAASQQKGWEKLEKWVFNAQDRETLPFAKLAFFAKKAGINIKQWRHAMQQPSIKRTLLSNVESYLQLHARRIPVVVIYPTGHPIYRYVLVGAQPVSRFQYFINQSRRIYDEIQKDQATVCI